MIQVDGIFVQQGGGGVQNFPFTYSGEFIIVQEDDVNWKAYLPISGILTFNDNIEIEYQLIGGGSGGGNGTYDLYGGRGGGGNSVVGTLTTVHNQEYVVTIGAGGTANANGNATSAFGQTAAGGTVGTVVNVFEFNDTSRIRQSGRGGAGGKVEYDAYNGEPGQNAGYTNSANGGGHGGSAGGYDGSNGSNGGNGWNGSTGGNGGRSAVGYSAAGGGGGGGGGYGGGGGGGGQCSPYGAIAPGGSGAPGVVILRNARG